MNGFRYIFLILPLLVVTNCTQLGKKTSYFSGDPLAATGLTLARSVTYGDYTTQALSMKLYNNYLLLTGKPFGFMVMDVTSPLNPRKIFAAKEALSYFTQNFKFGAWIPDYYASGGIEVFGSRVLTSGAYGANLINIFSIGLPFEENRFPAQAQNSSELTRDSRFMYKAIAKNPTNSNKVYGFTEQDGIWYINSSGSNLSLAAFQPYNNSGPVCCTRGVAQFGNKIFVARTHDIWIYEVASNGQLILKQKDDTIHAVNIFATSSLLYIQSANTPDKEDGIYVYNTYGELVAFHPLSPFQFVVTADDQYFLTNLNNTEVQVYQKDETTQY